jgi:phosphoribosylanthranilate isomerase
LIVLSDDKLTVNVPQIDYEYASRSIPGKSIENIKSSIPPREIVIAFDADDIQKFIKVAKNLNETIVRFTIPEEGEYINLSTDKRSKLEVHADIDNKYGEEFTVEFDINALEDSFAEAQLDITMGFVTEQTKDQYGNDVLYPVTFDYITGKNTEIDVSGLLIPHKVTW